MEQSALKVNRREAIGSRKCGRLRRRNLTPAVIYGHKEDTVHISVDTEALTHVIEEGSRMVTLDVEGTAETVLVRDVQFDTFGDEVLHVDFIRVAMDEEVEVEVELNFHGTPAGIEEGGVLEISSHNVLVACLPSSIPDEVRVEVGHLAMGDSLHVSDITAPEGVQLVDEPETVLAHVAAPSVLKAAEEPEGAEEGAEVEGEAAEGAEAPEGTAEAGGEEKEAAE